MSAARTPLPTSRIDSRHPDLADLAGGASCSAPGEVASDEAEVEEAASDGVETEEVASDEAEVEEVVSGRAEAEDVASGGAAGSSEELSVTVIA
jgi:hypothetical protein